MSDDTSSLAEAILDHAADAVIYADESGTIMHWNRAAAELFGYAPADALGRSLDLIIPEHMRAAHWKAFVAAMASGTTTLRGRSTLTRATARTGAKLYVEMSFAVVPGEGRGRARGAVAVARDVTQAIAQTRAGAPQEHAG